MDLTKYIGETSFYEKKVALEHKKPKSWLKTVVAFANTSGGKIFFGIDDNDKCVGLANAKKDAESISEFIKTKLEPLPLCELTIHSESSKEFIVLTVYSGKETPYYFSDSGNKIAYVRIGNESVVATNNQYKALILKGLNKTFDNLSTNINFNDVSFGLLKTVYYQKTRKELKEVDFTSFLLVDENNNLTNAGALFADGQLVYQSRIFATRWKGLNKSNGKLEAYDDKEYQGNLLYLLEKGEDFINSNSVKMWRKANHQRIEYPDYPELAVREALTNALIHRDYSEIGSEIHIDMYDDRLEIYSPGGMVDGSIIQNTNVYDVASKRRNPIIADVFNRMNLMERRGSGLKKILDSYVAQINYRNELEPEFKSSDSSFYIILKNLNYENNKRVAINDDIGDKTAAINQKNGDKTPKNNKLVAINQKNGDKLTAINGESGDKTDKNDIKTAINGADITKKVMINGESGDKLTAINQKSGDKTDKSNKITAINQKSGDKLTAIKLKNGDKTNKYHIKASINDDSGDKSPKNNKLVAINQKNGDKLTAISAIDNTKKAAIKQKSGDKPLYLKDKQKDIILDFAKKNKEFVSKEIETILNLKPSRVRFLLSELVEENLLAPIGANKNRKYTLNN